MSSLSSRNAPSSRNALSSLANDSVHDPDNESVGHEEETPIIRVCSSDDLPPNVPSPGASQSHCVHIPLQQKKPTSTKSVENEPINRQAPASTRFFSQSFSARDNNAIS